MLNIGNRIKGYKIILISLILTGFAALAIAPGRVGTYHDDGIYVILAKSLSENKDYRLINLPGVPYQAKYPPVYPLLLSLAWPIADFPQNIYWLKFINIIFLFLVLLGTYYLALVLLDNNRALAALAVVLVGTAEPVIYFSANILSDIPYLFFSLSAILLLLKARDCTPRYSKHLACALVSFQASLAWQTRTIGITLIVAIVAYLFFQKRPVEAACFAASTLILTLPWLVWQRHFLVQAASLNPLLQYYTAYSSPVQTIGSASALLFYIKTVVLSNIYYLGWQIAQVISTVTTAVKPLAGVVWVVLAAGIWRIGRKDRFSIVHFYLAFYMLALLCQPSFPHARMRYLTSILPFIVILFLEGTRTIYRQLPRGGRLQLYFAGLLVLLLLPNLSASIHYVASARRLPAWPGFRETISWIETNTSKDAIVACSYDPVYYLYTGRKALRPWFVNITSPYLSRIDYQTQRKDPEYSFQLLRTLGVDYLIVEPMGGIEGQPVNDFYEALIAKHRNEMELVFTSHDGLHKIYHMQERYETGNTDTLL